MTDPTDLCLILQNILQSTVTKLAKPKGYVDMLLLNFLRMVDGCMWPRTH